MVVFIKLTIHVCLVKSKCWKSHSKAFLLKLFLHYSKEFFIRFPIFLQILQLEENSVAFEAQKRQNKLLNKLDQIF